MLFLKQCIVLVLFLSNAFECSREDIADNQKLREQTPRAQTEDRVVGGVISEEGLFPWMAIIYVYHRYKNGTRFSNICGGSLIHPRWVLSAAHCFPQDNQTNKVLVHIGRRSPALMGVGRTRWKAEKHRVRSIFVHPLYHGRGSNGADLALLHLPRESAHPPIRVAQSPVDDAWYGEGAQATVAGWGSTTPYDKHQISKDLRHAEVKIVARSKCNSASSFDGSVLDDMFCAAGVNRDACYSDSGGPLMARDACKKEWVLIGVVSWGKSCAQKKFPGVYVTVTQYTDWINDHLQPGRQRSYYGRQQCCCSNYENKVLNNILELKKEDSHSPKKDKRIVENYFRHGTRGFVDYSTLVKGPPHTKRERKYIQGPKGEKGDRGPRGRVGAVGVPGLPGPPGKLETVDGRLFPSYEGIKHLTNTLEDLKAELKTVIHQAKIGKTLEHAARSCQDIVRSSPGLLNSGRYWLSPQKYDESAFIGYCNMDVKEGGWTLMKTMNQNKTKPPQTKTKPPQGIDDLGTVDISLWKFFGTEILLKSVKDTWLYCKSTNPYLFSRRNINAGGSFTLKCQYIGYTDCAESPPDKLKFDGGEVTLEKDTILAWTINDKCSSMHKSLAAVFLR